MRLSQAIILGSTITEPKAHNINHCALGMAANATGIPPYQDCDRFGFTRRATIRIAWPWLQNDDSWNSITSIFNSLVAPGFMSLDQLVAFIKRIEPDCDCSRFNCDCAKTALPEPAQEAVHA